MSKFPNRTGVFLLIVVCAVFVQPVAAQGDVGESVESPTGFLAMWEKLDGLSPADKANIEIRIEVDSGLYQANSTVIAHAETLWNSGGFDEAVGVLRSLEDNGLMFAVGMDWKVPKELDLPDWAGTDVRIGDRTNVVETHLDFDALNGNLFAVLRYPTADPEWQWSVNISTDGGQSWLETYSWFAPYEINDVSAAVVDDFLYVGYVANPTFDGARIRRFHVADGSVDGAYGNETVFDNDVALNEIALVTNADDLDNRLYYLAVQADFNLIYYWGMDLGTLSPVWTGSPTGVTNAMGGLDATWDTQFTGQGNFLFVSYIGSDGSNPVIVLRHSSGVWNDIEVNPQFEGVHRITSVSAFDDTVLVAYEHPYPDGPGIRYDVSYNDGDSWSDGSFAPEPGRAYYRPDVTARGGQGTAITFSEEAGEFDPVWVHYRDHYSAGAWNAMVAQINEVDAATAHQNLIQWIPPVTGEPYAFGVIYIAFDPVSGVPYFDRVPLIFVDGFESGDSSKWSATVP